MDLGRYIYQVLKHRNEVFVKGLGVFKRIHTSSVFDERKGVYLPPLTYLEFDPKSVDGVDIVEYVQQAKQVSHADAQDSVQEAVINLFEEIKDHGQASLTHLGQLIRHGNSLVFKAEDLSGFQLEPVEAGEILPTVAEAAPEEELEVEETVAEPAEEQTVEETEVPEVAPKEEPVAFAEEPEAIVEEPVYEEEVPRSSNKLGWFIAAAILAIAVIGGLAYNKGFFGKNTSATALDSNKNQVVEQNNTALATADSSSLALDSLGRADSTAAKDSATVKPATSEETKKPLIPAGHQYSIVIGKHATLAQAFDQAESFNKAGVTSVRVIPSKLAHNKKTVIWDTYVTKAEADSALRVVQKRHVADAWVQKLN